MKKTVLLLIFIVVFVSQAKSQQTTFFSYLPDYTSFTVDTVSTNKYDTKSIFYRNPSTAQFLSFFIPGAGQFYNGQMLKGVGFFIWTNVSLYVTTLSFIISVMGEDVEEEHHESKKLSSVFWVGLTSTVVAWICGQTDAYLSAKAINRNLEIAHVDFKKKYRLGFSPEIKPIVTYNNDIKPFFGSTVRLSF